MTSISIAYEYGIENVNACNPINTVRMNKNLDAQHLFIESDFEISSTVYRINNPEQNESNAIKCVSISLRLLFDTVHRHTDEKLNCISMETHRFFKYINAYEINLSIS